MAYTELDLRDRSIIEDMLNARMAVSKIAVALGRHRSTIYPDIGETGGCQSFVNLAPSLFEISAAVSRSFAATGLSFSVEIILVIPTTVNAAIMEFSRSKTGQLSEDIAGTTKPTDSAMPFSRTVSNNSSTASRESNLDAFSAVAFLQSSDCIIASTFSDAAYAANIRPLEEVINGSTEPTFTEMLTGALLGTQRTRVGPKLPQTEREMVSSVSSLSLIICGYASSNTSRRRIDASPRSSAKGPRS